MKLVSSTVLATIATLFALSSSAEGVNTVTVINHYGKPLHMLISRNPQILEDFSPEFTIADGQHVVSRVLEDQPEYQTAAYVYVTVANATDEEAAKSAFWWVEAETGKTQIHTDENRGIVPVFVWPYGNTVTFCTPENYKSKGAAC